MQKEIERRFLISKDFSLPENVEKFRIKQGYILHKKRKQIRLREINSTNSSKPKYFLTIKLGKGVERDELEVEISRNEFHRLWPQTEGARLEKIRFCLPNSNICIDGYLGIHRGLYIAEVEFNSMDEASSFIKPDFLEDEVTGNSKYSNHKLATENK